MFFVACICLLGAATAEWELVFEENFDGNEINPEYWSHEITAWGGGVSIVSSTLNTGVMRSQPGEVG